MISGATLLLACLSKKDKETSRWLQTGLFKRINSLELMKDEVAKNKLSV